MLLHQNVLGFFLPIRTDGFIPYDWSEDDSDWLFKHSLLDLQESCCKPQPFWGNHDLKHPNLKSRLHIVLQTSRIGSLLPSVLMCLLLQRMQMVHSAYLIQPRKKDALKVLLKLLAQSKYSSSSLKVSQSLHCPVAGRCFSLCLNCQINSFFLYCRKSF